MTINLFSLNVYAAFGISILVSCSNTKFDNYASRFYKEVKNNELEKIGRLDLSKSDSIEIFFPASMEYSGYCGIFSFRTLSKEDSISYLNESLMKIDAFDSCNIYAGKGDSLACGKRTIPVPNFRKKKGPFKHVKLDSGAFYAVTKFSKGYFFKEAYPVKDVHMPSDLDQGYSKGVIFCGKGKSIEWIVFW